MNRRFGASGLRALGRLKRGEKNKTEARYEEEVLKPGLRDGSILWYSFEGIKLRLADNTFLTIDYPVMRADCVLEMIDVKGSPNVFQDDAKVKMKVAAEMYPFAFTVAYPVPKKDGGGWRCESVGGD